ncbi:MAG: thioredoxin family protein [Parasphingorhabdus sp.]
MLVPAVASAAAKSGSEHPEARPYDKTAEASVVVDQALERAAATGKKVILVMGANWCHDSRGLAGWFAKPRFADMLTERYETVYIDVGMRDRNIDIAQRFGIKQIKGTPTILVLSSAGVLLNPKSAPKWRNAASRDEDDIFHYFESFEPETESKTETGKQENR